MSGDNIQAVFFSRYWRTLEKQRLIDEKELSTMEKDRDDFLKVAIRNYFQCLQCGDRHDLRIFRLTSLWFNNSSAGKVNKIFQVINLLSFHFDILNPF